MILLFKPLELYSELTDRKQSLVRPIVLGDRSLDPPKGTKMAGEYSLNRAGERDDILVDIVNVPHMRNDFTLALMREFTIGTAGTAEGFNPDYCGSQHRHIIFPHRTIGQSLDLILLEPFFQPYDLVLRKLLLLDFYK